ncbi:MAG: hypothetical protein H7Y09_03045 [Chitinophagaceae bacterium]|nr:hypothetical protein [Anaerolineae bacterium]
MAKKTAKQPKARNFVPRQTRKFQLRLNHPTDSHVGQILDYAKAQRNEVTMIRDGVRLLWALKNDDLNVLFELFPHLERQFKPDAEELIEQFRQMLSQQLVAAPVPQPALVAVSESAEQGGKKSLAAVKIALPLLDDDDDGDTIVITKANDGNSDEAMASLLRIAF